MGGGGRGSGRSINKGTNVATNYFDRVSLAGKSKVTNQIQFQNNPPLPHRFPPLLVHRECGRVSAEEGVGDKNLISMCGDFKRVSNSIRGVP